MREIKFRIWDGEQMQQVGVIDLDAERSMDYYNWYDGYSGENYPFERYPLMQFTGLKDKNGKEIYEGDIVAVENEGDVISKCIFELGQFILVDNVGGIWARQLYHQPHRLTIVGNIYQNPELFAPTGKND